MMNVYPNPAHDQLTINLKENSGQVVVQMLDLNGCVIMNFGKFNLSTFQLDMSDVASGLYVLQVIGNGNMQNTFTKVSVVR
jgi:hypothetical protein